MNPLEGLPGAPSPREVSNKRGEAPQKEDFLFYCDPCQKGFHTQIRYQEHLKDHIYCTVAGCGFTCRKSKQWKMELHVETLHNRPDAPQLQDVDAYLRQRKHRFPTSDAVQSKVEELFYKASRGEVLPDERRRWMRQHGVMIKRKRMRDESSYVSSNADKLESSSVPQLATETRAGPDQNQNTRVVYLESQPASTTAATSSAAAVVSAPPARKPRLVPEGPDGRLSKSQKVQLIREKYRESQVVPKFYVCNRCGEKGVHWVAECPMLHDERFERHNEWGEDHRPKRPDLSPVEVQEDTVATVPSVDDAGETESGEVLDEDTLTLTAAGEDNVNASADDVDDDVVPQEKDARDFSAAVNEKREFLKVIHPVAARRLRGIGASGNNSSRRSNTVNHEPQESLFNRLTADEGINDKGLVLQALRFFVARDFFNDQ